MSIGASTGLSSPKTNITGYTSKSIPNFTPEMMNLFQQLLGGAQGGVKGGLDSLSGLASGNDESFKQLEAPAYRSFDKALGQIGSRFAGAGAIGSSAFQNATSGAAQSLSENLHSQRVGLQQGALDRLLSLSQNLLQQRPYENVQEEEGGFDWGSLLGMLGGGIGGPIAGGIGQAALPKILKLLGLG